MSCGSLGLEKRQREKHGQDDGYKRGLEEMKSDSWTCHSDAPRSLSDKIFPAKDPGADFLRIIKSSQNDGAIWTGGTVA